MMTELDQEPPLSQPHQRPLRRIIVRNAAALPAVVTLLNGISGFVSIHYATRDGLGRATLPHLTTAAILIFAAMLFDALDGRLARITRHATDFGAQLDSLCDAISFGVAPAMLMLQTAAKYLVGDIVLFHFKQPPQPGPFSASLLGKLVFAIAVIYVCCAILRLARFNIENAPDLLHHLHFKGLPSPGAAATVAATVLLFDAANSVQAGVMSAGWLDTAVGAALPIVTLAVGLLMVSKFRYSHLLNQFMGGRKPFSFLLKALAVIVAGLVLQELALALATIAYAASGPVGSMIHRLRGRHLEAERRTAGQ